jgi:hypothetical protein
MTTSNAVTFNVVSDDERTLQQFRRGRAGAQRSRSVRTFDQVDAEWPTRIR